VTEFTRNGAEFLTIISNDGWWGDTQGHKQLLSLSKLRAIENRRAIARSANTGISAFINIYGEIEEQINYEKAGVLTNKLNLNNKITFYVKYQDYIARISFLLTLILFSISLSGRLKTKNITKIN
jgi:apolipoprotein N-acyltransferase